MAVKRGGLGRNLSALLGSSSIINNTTVAQMPVTEPQKLLLTHLQPGKYQPRKAMDENSLQELASSIRQQGLLQPLVVRALSEERYEIIAGERRWRACQLAGLKEVPVLIRQVDDETAMAIALVENLQREDLNPVDQARAMARLHEEFNLTHQQIADILSKSRTAVSNFLRLLSLSPDVMRLLENGDLDMGHAKALLVLDPEQQIQVGRLVVAQNLSVRETEKLANRVKDGQLPVSKKEQKEIPSTMQVQMELLADRLKARVNLKQGKHGKGSLIIHYDSLPDLQELIEQMMYETL